MTLLVHHHHVHGWPAAKAAHQVDLVGNLRQPQLDLNATTSLGVDRVNLHTSPRTSLTTASRLDTTIRPSYRWEVISLASNDGMCMFALML